MRRDEVVDVLVRARARIETPERWCQAPERDAARCAAVAVVDVAQEADVQHEIQTEALVALCDAAGDG